MKKKLVAIVLIFVLVMMTAGCGNETKTQNDDDVIVIKVAEWLADSHPMTTSLKYLEKIVEERTDGRIDIQVYPNAQLGSEETYIDAVIQGTIEMGVPGTMLSKYSPGIAVCEWPFLFSTWDQVRYVYHESNIGTDVTANLPEEVGVRNLGFTVNGFSEFSCKQELKTKDDFKGLKYRAANLDYHISMIENLGANPVPLAFSEVYTSLESGVIVGQYNPYATIFASNLYEVQDYVLESHHMFHPCQWIINEEFYQSIPEDLRKIFDECVQEALDYNWEISEQYDEEAKQQCVDAGMTINVLTDEARAEIIEAMAPTYELFEKNYPGSQAWVDKIYAELEAKGLK